MNNDPNLNQAPSEPNEPQQEPTSGARYCPRCGRPLPPDALFCGECGMNLQGGAQPASPAPQPILTPRNDTPLGTAEFFLILFLSAIPFVGLILQLVWGFSSVENTNRRNLCRAFLIMRLIGIALSLLFALLMASAFGSLIAETIQNSMYY